MTLDEAQKLAEIAAEVDNGCAYCIEAAVTDLNRAFPDYWWNMDEDGRVTVRKNPQRPKPVV